MGKVFLSILANADDRMHGRMGNGLETCLSMFANERAKQGRFQGKEMLEEENYIFGT